MLFYLALIKYEYIYIHISYINLVFYMILSQIVILIEKNILQEIID